MLSEDDINIVDTHRHLGGSIPVSWVWQTIQDNNWTYMGESESEVVKSMTMYNNKERDFHLFLDKFKILDQIRWTEDLIDGSIRSVCEILKTENIDYCWMDFSINKYMEAMNWHKKEAIQFIYDSFNTHYPRRVGLILSLKYESTRASQRQYAQLIEDPDIVDLLFGIDLVGDERYFDNTFYKPIFEQWSNAGKMTRAHTSECLDWQNSYNAIKNLNVTNIAHGINIIHDKNAVDIAIDRGVTFDLGVTSNYMTGACKQNHPIAKMLDMGLKLTLGTDDPVQCNCTLEGEYKLAKKCGVSTDQMLKMMNVAKANTLKYVV